ncbi:G-type lectin S-receptor-like serine/threonine-protein kinase B120, partial [Mucuna pruriens]
MNRTLFLQINYHPTEKETSCSVNFQYLTMVCFLFVLRYWLLWWSSCIHVIVAYHSLKPGETLNFTTELCSENNKFCIGFSQSNYAEYNSAYLRIYPKGQDSQLVWVGNRNQFVNKDSAVLLLDHTGALKIESKDGKPIILYSSPQPANNTMATLFDYPTDELLPGMKLGVNFKSGHNWSLVSWLGKLNPSLGAFSFEREPTSRELMIKRRGQLCWTSGELRNNNGFIHNTQYTIVSNENESYFTITTSNEYTKIWILLETGQLINGNGGDVARADMCYGYNTNAGCHKWEEIPSCRYRGDAFNEVKEVFVNPNLIYVLDNSSYGPGDCRAICWENCSFDGFTDYYVDGTGCTFMHWNSTEGANFASGGQKFYILVKNTHHKEKKRKGTKTTMLDSAIKDLEDEFKKRQDLKVFNYTSVLSATNDFSPENKLGQGGFGPVYKGILPTGQEAAIKRLSKTSRQGILEFKNELMLISEFQHKNLVQLLGCCIHEEERILIYEYMPNKSLDFYLFDRNISKFLDWKKRFNIIEGISQGLLYLHKYSRLKIIHRDLKASNILLDENMNPKISDFGLAKMFAEQESTANTTCKTLFLPSVVDNIGYMSPEYAMEGIFSTMSDVYSFGVLILEIVSGRRNTSFYDVDRPINLIGHPWELWNQGVSLQLMDPSLGDSFDPHEVKRCIHVGLLCAEQSANDRPTMSRIVSLLTNESAVVALPRRPAFYVERNFYDGKTSSTELCTNDIEEITSSS